MAQGVSLARAGCRPHHYGRYAVGPHQTSERAPEPDRRGIQFGSFALDGPSVFGECASHDRSCAISSQAVGHFSRRFPPGHGGAQPTLGAIHNKQILYVDDQAAHYDGLIQGQRPRDDEPFVNILGDLHSDLRDALENFISYIRSRRDADRDDEDLVPIHTMLLHICRPPTRPVVQHRPQTGCPLIRFLIVNSLKLDPSSTNLVFEHVRHVIGPVAILQYWWRCMILM